MVDSFYSDIFKFQSSKFEPVLLLMTRLGPETKYDNTDTTTSPHHKTRPPKA